MARRDSVTVSIAALTSGTFSRMFRVSHVLTSTCVGTISVCLGTSRTSSNVRAVARPVSIESSVGASVFSSMDTLSRLHCAVAFLVLLATSARTRVVSANLRLVSPNGLHGGVVSTDALGNGRAPGRGRLCRGRRTGGGAGGGGGGTAGG